MPVGFEVSAMKASFSLSSLDRSGGLLADSPDHVRVRTEKPYNSLTKKPRRAWESEFENWRHSLGSRDNEDSFLEPILPRIYTFLMDNTLIDTCKEAVGELCMDHKWQLLEEEAREGKASSSEVETLCIEAVEKEIRCLHHWIRNMEKKLRPMDFKTGFDPMELEDKAKEIQCLAVEVKAQGKVVASLILHCECLVAASAAESQEQRQEEEQQGSLEAEGAEGEEERGPGGGGDREGGKEEVEEAGEAVAAAAEPLEGAHCPQHQHQKQQDPSTKGSAADSLKVARWLEGRWHHLYLRALEWQCYIEELLSGGGNLPAKRRGQFNGDVPSPERGAEQSPPLSSEEEGGRWREEGPEEGRRSTGATRKGRAGQAGGPLVKKPRLGAAEEEGRGGGGPLGYAPSAMMEAASSVLDHDSPSPRFASAGHTSALGKSEIMKDLPFMERMDLPPNCGYLVIRRIDTDSEAETKENGMDLAEDDAEGSKVGGMDVGEAMGSSLAGTAVLNGDTEETEGEEEDEEWVYSHVAMSKILPPEERDVRARKTLLFENGQEGDKDRHQSERDGMRASGRRVFESLKLNSSVSDGSKGKYARIRQWLRRGGPAGEESAESQEEQAPRKYPIDSCDASGEYTSSGESSEAESQSSGDLDGSIATCRKSSTTATTLSDPKTSPFNIQDLGISSLSLSPTDGDVTPVADGRAFPGASGSVNLSPSGKMVLRVKRRKNKSSSHHQRSPKSEQKRRPWSICVSGHSHLVTMTSPVSSGVHPLPITSQSTSPTPNSPDRAKIQGTVRSASELAIHCLAYSSSSCSTGVDDVGSNTGRVGIGSGELTPMRSSMDGEGVGSGAGSAGTGSSRRKKIRTRRRNLGQRSESGNSDSLLGEVGLSFVHHQGSRSSSKGLSPGSKGSSCQSTGSDFSSSNMVADEAKEEVDGEVEDVVGRCKETLRMQAGVVEGSLPQDEDECEEEEEKLGSLQTEETSSYSEQAWDNYQVCLSEGGEYTSDDDKTTKEQLLKNLMEFGDDYRQHFDSLSDGGSSLARQPPTPCSTLDSFPGDGQRSLPRSHSPTPPSPGSSSRTGSGRRKRQAATGLAGSSRLRLGEVVPPSMFPPEFLSSQGPPSLGPMVNIVDGMCSMNPMAVLDSDSDLEDVNHFLQESLGQVMFTEGMMEKALSGGFSALSTLEKFPPPADYAEMAATCRENIKCLRAFLDSVSNQGGGTMLPPRDFWAIKDLVHRWEMLESRAEECHQVRLLHQEIAALREAMVAPSAGRIRNGRVEDLQSRKELDRRVQEVKAEIAALFELKNELLDVNVSVNRFLTGTAQPIQCPSVTTSGPQGSVGGGEGPEVGGQDAGVPGEDASGHHAASYAFLKDEVAEMYRDWDESFGRLNSELAALQRASRTWAELEDGLSSLGSALSSDRSALTTLSTAVAAARGSPLVDDEELPPVEPPLTKGTQTPALLAASVRELARVLSEEKAAAKVGGPRGDKEEEEPSHVFMGEVDHNGDVHMSFGMSADPLGSLSDSGISDSGSEGRGMCERGRRLAALRKLARALAATLGPNSPPLVALKQRLDDFQKELRSLQRTCRELVFCTAMLCSATQARNGNSEEVASGRSSFSAPSEAKTAFTADAGVNGVPSYQVDKEDLQRVSMMLTEEGAAEGEVPSLKKLRSGAGGGGDGGGDDDLFGKKKGRGGKGRRHWLWRALCLAMPFQLAVVLLLYAAYFLEPHCCSAINNLSFSLTPQLHYVRGPPPV